MRDGPLRVLALATTLTLPSVALGDEPALSPLPLLHPLKVDSLLTAHRAYLPTNSMDMRLITEIQATNGAEIAFGDTDHDEQNEIIIAARADLPCNYSVFEQRPNNILSLEYRGPCLYPYATGDLDGDGRSELLGQYGGFIQVYEGIDASSYPTELTWSSPFLSNIISMAAVGDTDQDGRMEIVCSQNFIGPVSILDIFENTGDSSFVPVFSDTIIGGGSVGNKVIADLDGDGMMEIAFSGIYGVVRVYECTSNNSWVRTWSDSTGMLNAYAVAVGADADGNGKPELFVMGSSSEWTTLVYESVGDNRFARVATMSIQDGYSGTPYNAAVNLDNLGRQEYVMDTGTTLCIYQAEAPGQWLLVGQVPDPPPFRAHDGVYGFDINRNGRPELVWAGAPTTLILEYRSGIADVGENLDHVASLAVFPNPNRGEAGLRVSTAIADAASLAVYDVAGRVVERRLLVRDDHGQILWPTRQLASGVYVLRLQDAVGRTLAVGRGTIVR
jgi:VCBS repeat protein